MSGQWIDLGLMDYQQAYALQQQLVALRHHTLQDDLLLSLEHPPVYTLGKRGGMENLGVDETFLQRHNIPVVPIERGGNITYHGPGQAVIYPIISLKEHRLAVKEYVWILEEIMLQTAACFDVPACRDERNRGIWVGSAKMGSLGIAVRQGVSFHGLALNVNTDLRPFSWITPCGIQDATMTSLALERGAFLCMEKVRQVLLAQCRKHLAMALEPVPAETLYRYIKHQEHGQ